MREENHSNNSHNWNPAEAKPKNGSSSHISEFPMSLQPAFSSPVCLLPDISSIMKQSKAENATEVDALLYLIKVCWITMKQNDTNLKVRASKNQRDFPCLPNTCSHKVKDEFMFPKHFLFYEGDCEQMHTEVWLKKSHCYSWTAYAKTFLRLFREQRKRVPSLRFRRDWNKNMHPVWGSHYEEKERHVAGSSEEINRNN